MTHNYKKYNLIDTPEKLLDLDEYLFGQDGSFNFRYLAVDTETNGLHFWKNVVIGVSLAVDSDKGFYIPLLTWIPDTSTKRTATVKKKKVDVYAEGHFICIWTGDIYPENVTSQEYSPPDMVAGLLEDWFTRKVKLLMHNAPFDVLMLKHSLGIDVIDKLYCDTIQLKHVLDENTPNNLKDTAVLWQEELGIDMNRQANAEQRELGNSVIKNGGAYTKFNKSIWRGDLDIMCKYASADAFLTYGIYEVGMEKFKKDYEDKHLKWFFKDEVMPVCREVIIPMRESGVHIDVPYFKKLADGTRKFMESLEDDIMGMVTPHLADFTIGKSFGEVVSKGKLVKKIMELEGLKHPTITQKGEVKQSLAKKAVQEAYNADPHWLWGYLLGDDVIKYDDAKLDAIKAEIYQTSENKRYQFNIGSDMHLRWLMCDKFGHDKTKLPQTDSATADNPIASMKAEVLKDHFLGEYDFIKPLLLWKKLKKQYTTYILPAVELNVDGKLYMSFGQDGTVSGRLNCRGGYNLQTLPRSEELECSKCGCGDVEVEHIIEIIANVTCTKCNNIDEDVFTPSAIKKGFISPEGFKLVAADYSSLEPRIFAFMSGDDKIKDVYRQGLDLYSKIYCDMCDHEGKYSANPKDSNYLKKAAPKLRAMFKPVVLGIPYGMRDYQTARAMGLKIKKSFKAEGGGTEIKEVFDMEAGKYNRDLYLNTYTELRKYMLKQENQALTAGWVETIVGRRRHFKTTKIMADILSRCNISYDEFINVKRKAVETRSFNAIMDRPLFEETMEKCGYQLVDEKGTIRTWAFLRAIFIQELNNAKNMPIQGLAAHITNMGMLTATRMFKAAGLASYVILNIHDEIVVLASEEEAEETFEILQIMMEDNIYTELVDIPMIAEPIIGNNMKECK